VQDTIADILFHDLSKRLAGSSFDDRRVWAREITAQKDTLEKLLPLLFGDKKTAYRFSWLLSDVGETDKDALLNVLPYLFENRQKVTAKDFEQQFVKYWRICGVPEVHKGAAIDMMFSFLVDPKVNTHIKTISLTVLHRLCDEYPELKNELKLCIEDQLDHSTVSFNKTANKILSEL